MEAPSATRECQRRVGAILFFSNLEKKRTISIKKWVKKKTPSIQMEHESFDSSDSNLLISLFFETNKNVMLRINCRHFELNAILNAFGLPPL